MAEKRMLILDLGRVISDATARGGNAENILRLMFHVCAANALAGSIWRTYRLLTTSKRARG